MSLVRISFAHVFPPSSLPRAPYLSLAPVRVSLVSLLVVCNLSLFLHITLVPCNDQNNILSYNLTKLLSNTKHNTQHEHEHEHGHGHGGMHNSTQGHEHGQGHAWQQSGTDSVLSIGRSIRSEASMHRVMK